MAKKSTKAKEAGRAAAGAKGTATRSTTRTAVKPGLRAAAAKPGPVAAETTPAAESPAPEETGDAGAGVLKKPELLEAVILRSGVRKRDAKPVVEALLAVLGEAVATGRDLNLEPFGKLKINRSQTGENGRVTVARLRQKGVDRQAGESEPEA